MIDESWAGWFDVAKRMNDATLDCARRASSILHGVRAVTWSGGNDSIPCMGGANFVHSKARRLYVTFSFDIVSRQSANELAASAVLEIQQGGILGEIEERTIDATSASSASRGIFAFVAEVEGLLAAHAEVVAGALANDIRK